MKNIISSVTHAIKKLTTYMEQNCWNSVTICCM